MNNAEFVQAGPDCISHTWWLPWAYQPVISWLKSTMSHSVNIHSWWRLAPFLWNLVCPPAIFDSRRMLHNLFTGTLILLKFYLLWQGQKETLKCSTLFWRLKLLRFNPASFFTLVLSPSLSLCVCWLYSILLYLLSTNENTTPRTLQEHTASCIINNIHLSPLFFSLHSN